MNANINSQGFSNYSNSKLGSSVFNEIEEKN